MNDGLFLNACMSVNVVFSGLTFYTDHVVELRALSQGHLNTAMPNTALL